MKSLAEIQRWYASMGITTAQNGISSPSNIKLLQSLQRTGKASIDIISYPNWQIFNDVLAGERKLDIDFYPPGYVTSNQGRSTPVSGGKPTPATVSRTSRQKVGVYVNRVKFGGVKITGDGSPQGKTAYLTQPYLHPPHGQPSDYRAYPTIPQSEMDAWIDAAWKHNFQVLVHCNGDAAADGMIAAVRKAVRKYGKKDLRPVMIHAQAIRHDQVDAMKQLGIVPSFFSAHTFYWGDWHIQETLGRKRAFGISPMAYAQSIGLKFSNHTDSPVVPPDMLMLTWTAVNRLSRSGVVVGPQERVSPYVALKSITEYAAWQYFEEASKGTLEPGKRADMVVLSANPLKVSPLKIRDIRVMQTLKDGMTLYRRKA